MFNKKGFTLMETVIVISVLLILTTAVSLNFRQSTKSSVLERTAEKLKQDLEHVSQMALDTEIYKPLGTIPDAYGVYFPFLTTQQPIVSYNIYAECDGNFDTYNGTCGASPNQAPERIRTIETEKEVNIKKICIYNSYEEYLDRNNTSHGCAGYISDDSKATPINPATSPPLINFTYPFTRPGTPLPGGDFIAITLSLKDDISKTKDVLVNFVGLVETK